MDEGTSKAIPLRRSRGGARSPATRISSIVGIATGWSTGLTGGVRRAIEPGHQLWLAGLGSTTLTLRGAREVWSLLVAEGAATEHWLRHTLRRGNGNGSANGATG